jgi:hypothetical protein
MPIIIQRRSNPPPAPHEQKSKAPLNANPKPRRFDDAVKALAPVIAEIRKAGRHGIAEIATCLNDRGLLAPSGGPFRYETTRRILNRIKLLGVGDGPRTKSAALLVRAEKDRARRKREFAEDVARRSAGMSKVSILRDAGSGT